VTARQLAIRELILRGLTSRQMAAAMARSERTVRTQIGQVLEREGCASMRELMAREIDRLREAV